ncbi:truncated NFkB inhibitor [Vaccinia virus]|uniref:Truncated NFkB inhibitor n=1 Tax=Vaccinia virus TaxID=10245 RepID=A0A0M3UMP6_VACCV|nr:truncated NFkB inhibitor [Vaccinia virus]
MDTIKIFNHGSFDTIKNELVNLLKVVKWNGIIYRHNKYI